MRSESKPPAVDNSRRDFFKKIGTLAAASGVLANASTPASAAAGTEPQPKVPTVKFGKYDVSRLIIGSNPVAGLSHLSHFIDVEMRAWNTEDRLNQAFARAEALGINCMEDGGRRVPAYNKAMGGKMLFTTRNTAPADESIKPGRGAAEIAKGGCIAIHHGGAGDTGTDAWWRRGKLDRVREWCKNVRDAGVLVAVTSHRPEVFDIIESQNWDVDYYMCCVYKYGRTKAEWEKEFGFNPGLAPAEVVHYSDGPREQYYGDGNLFVRGDPPAMYKVVKQAKKPCFVYKILASGRLCDREEYVEQAFKECFENIKPTDAVVVGMYDKQSDQYTINAGYARKYGSNSTTTTAAL
jgi:hypothetical protein